MTHHYQGRVDAWSHELPFDPTYNHSLDDLIAVTPPLSPHDFDSFWQNTYQENQALSLTYQKKTVNHRLARFNIYQLFYSSWGGFQTGAWVVAPNDQPITRGVVVGHGYGGRDIYDPTLPIRNAAFIFPVARGFDISQASHLPANDSSQHVIHGIDSREHYIIRGCVAEQWTAATLLQQIYPEIEDNLYYWGVSFGGGLGALMLPWDSRFKKAFLQVPTFGHQPWRLQHPSVGSSEAVRQYYQDHPEVSTVLAYYDAANAAQRITIPVFVAPALFDPAVPPPGQFAVCNAIAGPTDWFISSAGHFEYPTLLAEARQLHECLSTFFA